MAVSRDNGCLEMWRRAVDLVGKPPTQRLMSVFETFKSWLGKVYKQLAALEADLAELEALLPPVLFSLWARQHGLADHWRTEPPQASFEVSLHALSPLLAPGLQLQQPIATIAPAPGGGIFAAGLGYVASLDSALQLRATWQPDATDPSLFFYYMTTSATGTLYSMTSSGQGWLLRRGAEGFERFSGIQPLPPAITAAPLPWFFGRS